jgi:hypothetical protein
MVCCPQRQRPPAAAAASRSSVSSVSINERPTSSRHGTAVGPTSIDDPTTLSQPGEAAAIFENGAWLPVLPGSDEFAGLRTGPTTLEYISSEPQ